MKFYLPLPAVLFAFMCYPVECFAQCPAGYTRDTLNWDYLDFLPNSGRYVSPTAFITLAQSQTQRFSYGTQKVTVTHNYSGANVVGEVSTHSGENGSYGKGDDLRFIGNGQVTFTFQNPVIGTKFSVYDIDRNQRVAITAVNGATPVNIDVSSLAGTILTLTGSGTANPTATASATDVGANANTPSSNGTLNVDINDPVTSVTIEVTLTGTSGSEDGSFYISDISACSAGTYPLNYYHVSKPFAGQPSYVISVLNNTVFYVDVATGVARRLFTDPGHTNINSLAYDPYRHMVYYAYSLTSSPVNDRTVKRYDYDMDTLGVFIPNVNHIGIPTYDDGVESAAAAFYNNSLYLGIEGAGDNNTNRESTVWRIDMDPLHRPTTAVQAFALPVDNGSGRRLHDWSDIGINDGILYDFDGAAGSGYADFYHYNLLTGQGINYKPNPTTLVPRQVCVDWSGQMFSVGSASTSVPGTIVPYIGNGMVNSAQLKNLYYNGVYATGSWGDAAEAFKPKTDFGDAPASYDPSGIDPATHERNDSLRLGDTIGIEWSKNTSPDASGDGAEEDGVTGLQVISPGVSTFIVPVKVYNTTGRNAILVGWVDANGDGEFHASEGTSIIVPSNPAAQMINLAWTGINVILPPLANTFMRLRLATTDQGLTASTPNGYMDNGEVEDHMVTVNLLLPEQKVQLKAIRGNGQIVNVSWELNNEAGNIAYELQRSANGETWKTIRAANATGETNNPVLFFHTDDNPNLPVSYYRVKVIKQNGPAIFSAISKVEFKSAGALIVAPNPAKGFASLTLQSNVEGKGTIQVLDNNARLLYNESITVRKGANEYYLTVIQKLSQGVYSIRVIVQDQLMITNLVVL